MRVGVVGTGHWATSMHAPVVSHHAAVELAGIWGRNAERSQAAAIRLGVAAFDSFNSLLDDVDVVQFVVPPSVQAPLAVEAARAGKHLFLEKPVAMTAADAGRVDEAVKAAGVAALVFHTARFRRETEAWLQQAAGGAWTSANGEWITAALSDPTSPWALSSWRWERGALWDLGPHVLSMLIPLLGDVTGVTSRRGHGDLVHVVWEHAGGRTSAVTFTLRAPRAAERETISLWGPSGSTVMPQTVTPTQAALHAAIGELVEMISTGSRTHRSDVGFGIQIVRALEAVEEASPEPASVWVTR